MHFQHHDLHFWHRKQELYDLKSEIDLRANSGEKKILRVIFIYINEAHSSKWPIGRDHQPDPHTSIADRISHARKFQKDNAWPYEIFIDCWDNSFEELFHAWPDKYYLLDSKFKILARSTYGTEDHNDAVVDVDSTDVIRKIIGI